MAENGGSSTTIPEQANIDAISDAGNAADNNDRKARRNQMRKLSERKRRNRIRNSFDELQALMPHVTEKSDKKTLVGHAIDYIQYLEKRKDMLEKRKQEQALARQVAAEAGASSSSTPPPPQAAQGMAVMLSSDVVPDGCHDVPPLPLLLQQPLTAAMTTTTMSSDIPQPQPLAVVAVPAPLPPQLPMAAAGQVRIQTFSWPNLVLNLSNDNAYINVCAPRHLGMQTINMVLSVLNKYGIDAVTAQVDSDAVRSLFNIYARVTRMGGENPSSEEVYKLAMSEILVWLNTN